MKRSIALLGFVAVASVAGTAAAQTSSVGYPPAKSPFVDLEFAQELTFFGGNYHAHRDPVNVGPQSGPIFGVHYSWRPSGPVHLITEAAYMNSDRRLINPLKAGAARELGTVSRPLYSIDGGLGLSLTGGRSWHRLVPEISSGIGLVSDLRTKPDSGGFKFGTRFAFNMAAGLRIVPGHGSRWQIRGDVKDRMYTLAYPQTYYTPPTGGTAVAATTQAKSFWMHNPAFTLGLSYLF